MALVRHLHRAGIELSPEEREAARLRIEAAARRPYTDDPDSPLLTEKQLAEFRPVHFSSMEERAKAMEVFSPREQHSNFSEAVGNEHGRA